MRRVSIVTGYRPGGPYYWADRLVDGINQNPDWHAKHPQTLATTLLESFISTADVFHTTLPIFPLTGRPVVLTMKGDFTREDSLLSKRYPRAIKNADVITTPSHFLKERLGLKDAIVIPNGLDLVDRVAIPNREKDQVKLLTVTKFWFKEKAQGVSELGRIIFEVAKNSNQQLTWDVLGEGSYRSEIEEQLQKLKPSNLTINFRGFVKPASYYRNSDIFVYWSDLDNFPNALLEASSYSLPIITNNVGAVAEIINNQSTGVICETSQEYVKEVEQLISAPDRAKQLGEKARDRMEKYFDNAKIIDRYLTIYEQVLSK